MAARSTQVRRICPECQRSALVDLRATYCSPACRQAAYRAATGRTAGYVRYVALTSGPPQRNGPLADSRAKQGTGKPLSRDAAELQSSVLIGL
jgi:hypothetical protein